MEYCVLFFLVFVNTVESEMKEEKKYTIEYYIIHTTKTLRSYYVGRKVFENVKKSNGPRRMLFNIVFVKKK